MFVQFKPMYWPPFSLCTKATAKKKPFHTCISSQTTSDSNMPPLTLKQCVTAVSADSNHHRTAAIDPNFLLDQRWWTVHRFHGHNGCCCHQPSWIGAGLLNLSSSIPSWGMLAARGSQAKGTRHLHCISSISLWTWTEQQVQHPGWARFLTAV